MRHQDWPERLADFIESRRAEPFAWGMNDCCLFACDAVLAMTGVDAAAAYRGRYKTQRGAYALLRRIDGGGIEEAARRAWGEPLPAPLMAQRGDPVLIETEYGPGLGICLGATIACVTPSGLTTLPITAAEMVWRV